MYKSDIALLINRITLAGLLLPHGLKKLEGISVISKWLESVHLPSTLSYGIYLGEIIAPIFILVGLLTRFSAMMVSITMLFSIWFLLSNGAPVFSFNEYGGLHAEINLLFLFLSLSIVFSGPGKFSIQR